MYPEDLINLAAKAADAYDRPDLSARLRASRALAPDVRITVIGGPNQGKTLLTYALAAIPLIIVDDGPVEEADVAVVVADPAAPEWSRPACPTVIRVLTKTDLYPSWRDAVADDVIPVSAELRLHAVRLNDRDLNDESGFPRLLSVLYGLDDVGARTAAYEVLAVVDELTTQLLAERNVAPVGPSHRWQQVLNDGIADLIADIEHDLRDRLRVVIRAAEAEIDAVDPAKVGDELTEWLHGKETECTTATYEWMVRRAQWLAGQVAELFDCRTVPEIHYSPEVDVTDFTPAGSERFGLGQKLIVGMRGGYGGTLMIGMLSTVAGVAMINPLSVGAGLLLGGKTVHDERRRMLQRRQAEAKAAVRRHVDDVVFQAGKQCRDVLREVHRTLRDHFARQAEESQRAYAESLAMSQARVRDLDAELARVANLARMAQELV